MLLVMSLTRRVVAELSIMAAPSLLIYNFNKQLLIAARKKLLNYTIITAKIGVYFDSQKAYNKFTFFKKKLIFSKQPVNKHLFLLQWVSLISCKLEFDMKFNPSLDEVYTIQGPVIEKNQWCSRRFQFYWSIIYNFPYFIRKTKFSELMANKSSI